MSKEDFTKTTSEESAKTVIQLSLTIFKEIKNRAINEIKIRNASKNYFENYLTRNGYIKILGMPQPKPIQEIYTNVIIVDPSYLNKEREIELLEQNFRETRRHFNNKSVKSGIEVANETSKLNILGPPGSGKSTFLKRVGILALLNKTDEPLIDEIYHHTCIPVLIELKRFRNEPIDIKTAIQKEFEIAGFPESISFVENALKSGKLLILLDGLDEVPLNKLDDTISHIKDFTDKYKNNRFITSCRTAFYKTYFKGFTDIEIAPFNDNQIVKFIQNWFSSENDLIANTHTRFIDLLFDKSHQSTLELSRTPLLLTFLCLTFDESQRFPANRSSLYKRALLILLEKWAAEKRIHNDDIYQNLSSDLEIEMLSVIAANFFKENKIFFFTDEIKKAIRSFIEDSMNTKIIDQSKILDAIEVQQGLLVQRAPDIYSFSHLTIQEYLTAYYYNSPNGVKNLIENYFFDKRWNEVFLLLAGIGKSDDMLMLMIRHLIVRIGSNDVYLKIKNWLNNILKPDDNFERRACRKMFLVSLLLHYKRYDQSHEINLGSYSNKLLSALDPSFARSFLLKDSINKKNSIEILELASSWGVRLSNYNVYREEINSITSDLPVSNMLFGSRFKYRKQILIPFYDALGVPDDIGFLQKKEYRPILNYIEGYTLVVNCKIASLQLSKETWKSICLNLFE